jgi:16S rRNA (uracil1498-N3)-methyltransferase
VVVREHLPVTSLPTFVTAEPFQAGQTITLGEDEAHHIRVRRLEIGERVGLLDGHGTRGDGVIVRLAKRHAAVQVEHAEFGEPPPAVHLLLPIADRDRMLWLAEKATELAATSWRPVNWKRSRSVSPRGEGTTFQQRVAARMASALGQSHGAWLPSVFPDATVERAIAATPEGLRLAFDAGGTSALAVLDAVLDAALAGAAFGGAVTGHNRGALPAITIAVGPEGGFEDAELALLAENGFSRVSLGPTILRFETAAIAALALTRAVIDARAGAVGGTGRVNAANAVGSGDINAQEEDDG